MKNYSLSIDGDSYEQRYWSLFIQNQFKSYEDFWIKNITPPLSLSQFIGIKEGVGED